MTVMRVVKVGGRAQEDAALAGQLADGWRAHPGSLCVVHGGAVEIDRLQRRLGTAPSFVGGRRVTTADDLDVVRMALCGTANKRLVSALCSSGVRAVGVSGEDASMIRATPIDRDALGYAGRPVAVDPALLQVLLASGFLPVVAPLGTCADGHGPLNVNGDDAATAVAGALRATELLFVTDVEGVMRAGATIPELGADEALALVASGEASGGMAVKVEGAVRALGSGVVRVRIGSVGAITDSGRGTIIRSTEAH